MKRSKDHRYSAHNPSRIEPKNMKNRELLEVYSSYAKMTIYDKDEQDYVGELRLEMLDRMDKSGRK